MRAGGGCAIFLTVRACGMQINTNLLAQFGQRHLDSTSAKLGQSLSRLSSGLRVNSAKDDAAGLAIGDRMTSRIRGNNQALRNANDGTSMMQVAEGAMSTVGDMLQRVRELAVQAANGTLSGSDRQALQSEANQLLQGINQIGQDTVYNGMQLFSQAQNSMAGDPNKRAVLDGLQLGWLEASERRIATYFGIKGDGAQLEVNLNFTDGAGNVAASVSGTGGAGGKVYNQFLNIDMQDFSPPNLPNGGSAPMFNDRIIAHEMVHAVMGRSMNFTALSTWFKEGAAELIHGADERLSIDLAAAGGAASLISGNDLGAAWGSTSASYSNAYAAVRYMHEKLKASGADGIKELMTYLSQNSGSTLSAALNAVSGGSYANEAAFISDWNTNGAAYIASMDLSNADTGAIGGLDADNGQAFTKQSVIDDNDASTSGTDVLQGFKLVFPDIGGSTGTKQQTYQVGAEKGQTLDVSLGALNASALGINTVDLSTLPKFAIYSIDRAINYVTQERAKVGAALSRLDSVRQNLAIASENVSASRSRIMDTDFAEETGRLTRQQVLQQASTAMLAQANTSPQLALQLLR